MIQFTVTMPKNFIGDVSKLMPTTNDCYELAIMQMTTIRQRTQAGLDAEGQQFQEYAEMTKKRKMLLGRDPELVDLTDRNRMLGQSMQTAKMVNGARIFFADANRREIALKHNLGSGRIPQRMFFSVSKSDADKLNAKLQSLINARAH